ncbi:MULTISPECIES: RodZ domain-containing protein [unclassified Leptolyngbya]|nr:MULTISPECIES: RodZ domain-containing protein [unclassified Leptolyngbya]MBD2155349.1 helix-turn-helix domain-containing protein [Leptolyngbya sp. FACHB-16]
MSEATSPLEQQQAEKLAQIGNYLQQVREEQSLSIEQIATTTMVQARLLRAIENGNLKQLPEPVYIRGFLKRYAMTLGLDGDTVAEAFPIKTDSSFQTNTKGWQQSSAAQLRPMHLYAAYLALIVAAIAGLSYVLTRGPVRTATPIPSPVTPSPELLSPSPSPSATPVSSPRALSKPVEVDVTLKEQSWMRVQIDGKTEFEGMLNADTQRTFTAEREIKIRAGNAGGVVVAYNNQPAKPLGARGTVEEVTFTPKGNNASTATNAGTNTSASTDADASDTSPSNTSPINQ